MAGTLQEFFRKPPAVGDRIPLGVISLQRPRESDGIPPLERHHYEAGREAGGEFSLLVVYRDGKRWVSQPDNGLAFDVGVSALLMDLDKRMQDRRVRLWQERR